MSLVDKFLEIDYPFPVDRVHYALMGVANQIKGMNFKGINNNVYVFKSKTSFWSWGENVLVTLNSLPNSHTRVSIRSTPVVPTTLVDWGKNKKNIILIKTALDQVLSR